MHVLPIVVLSLKEFYFLYVTTCLTNSQQNVTNLRECKMRTVSLLLRCIILLLRCIVLLLECTKLLLLRCTNLLLLRCIPTSPLKLGMIREHAKLV